jgi:hypothetical protein
MFAQHPKGEHKVRPNRKYMFDEELVSTAVGLQKKKPGT